RLADARTRLILAVRLAAGRVVPCRALRFGSGSSLRTGWGCVFRTGWASISCSSALVGVEDFVISPLLLVGLRGFPSQALGLQSFVIFPEPFLRYLVFRCCLPFTGALKRAHRLSSRQVFP